MIHYEQGHMRTEVRRIHPQEGDEEQNLEGQLLAALLLDHLVQDVPLDDARRDPGLHALLQACLPGNGVPGDLCAEEAEAPEVF